MSKVRKAKKPKGIDQRFSELCDELLAGPNSDENDRYDTLKALLSAQFLLEYCPSCGGGDHLTGAVARGLASVILTCAQDVNREFNRLTRNIDDLENKRA